MIVLFYGFKCTKKSNLYEYLKAHYKKIIRVSTLRGLITVLDSFDINIVITKKSFLEIGGLSTKSRLFIDTDAVICTDDQQTKIVERTIKSEEFRQKLMKLSQICIRQKVAPHTKFNLSKKSQILFNEFINTKNKYVHKSDLIKKILPNTNPQKAYNQLYVRIHRLKKELEQQSAKRFTILCRNNSYLLLDLKQKDTEISPVSF